MSSYLDKAFKDTWECLEIDLDNIKHIFESTKHERIMDDAKTKQLYAIAREAGFFQSSRRDIERALQSGQAPTDEQVKGVRVFEERLFRELEHLARLEDEERALIEQRTVKKDEDKH